MSWRNLIRFIPKLLIYALLTAIIFVIASILAAFGRRFLLDDMLSTFRRWHLVPPKTALEKHNHAVAVVNWTYLTHGYGIKRFVLHVIWRATGRKVVGHFLEDELAELKGAFGDKFLLSAAGKDDLGMVIALTSLLDRYIGVLIVVRFLVSISKRDYDRIFGGYGPVASFSSKIAMGTALGVVFGDMAHDLAILKKIRNDFAHGIALQRLADEPHASRCRSLKMSDDLSPEFSAACGTEERRRVLASVAAQILYMTIILQRGIVEREVLREHSAEINARTKHEMEKVRQASLQTVVPIK